MSDWASRTLQIVPFAEEHESPAAALLATRYRAVRRSHPRLPAGFEDETATLPLVRRLRQHAQWGPGVAALRAGRLAGYLLSQVDPPFARTGMQQLAVDPADGPDTLQALYGAVADDWLAKGCPVHQVKVFAGEREDLEAWFSLGFGQLDLQVLRDTSSVPHEQVQVDVRRALPEDAELVIGLQLELARDWATSPVFRPFALSDDDVRKETSARLADPDRPCWVGSRGGDAIAFIALRPGPGSGLSPLLQLEQMVFVDWALARDADVASAMLNHALDWARARRYEYCYGCFYSADLTARRFWLGNGFRPVACWLERRIDQRIATPTRGLTGR